jgi:hypothetical protein
MRSLSRPKQSTVRYRVQPGSDDAVHISRAPELWAELNLPLLSPVTPAIRHAGLARSASLLRALISGGRRAA